MSQHSPVNTVSRAAAKDLVDMGLGWGIMSSQSLKALGWDTSEAHDVTSRIPESLHIALWKIIAEHNKGRGLGLRIGQMINPDAKGLLASWISQSKNLREALTIFRKNILLMNPSESWEVAEENGAAILTFSLRKGRGYPNVAIERSMSAMVAWARALSGRAFEVEESKFNFPAPSYLKQFHPIFGGNIMFDSLQNQLVLRQEVLDLPVVSNNPFLKDLIGVKAERNLAEIQNDLAVQDKVLGLLREAMKAGEALTITEVSNALAVSRQTLYRQLKEERTDFQSLQELVRKTEALKLLDSGQSITAITLSLGYKDNSSFYKAFKRWFGTSPKNYSNSTN
jgi:AraC-like DNA-binding protein